MLSLNISWVCASYEFNPLACDAGLLVDRSSTHSNTRWPIATQHHLSGPISLTKEPAVISGSLVKQTKLHRKPSDKVCVCVCVCLMVCVCVSYGVDGVCV